MMGFAIGAFIVVYIYERSQQWTDCSLLRYPPVPVPKRKQELDRVEIQITEISLNVEIYYRNKVYIKRKSFVRRFDRDDSFKDIPADIAEPILFCLDEFEDVHKAFRNI